MVTIKTDISFVCGYQSQSGSLCLNVSVTDTKKDLVSSGRTDIVMTHYRKCLQIMKGCQNCFLGELHN